MDSAKANDPYADQGPAIIGVSVGLLGLAVVLVLIRLAYRVRTHAVGADDYLIFLSVVRSSRKDSTQNMAHTSISYCQ